MRAAENTFANILGRFFARLPGVVTLATRARSARGFYPTDLACRDSPLRKLFSRLLLVALVGVLIFAIVWFIGGPGESGAVVRFGTSIDPNELNHEAFRVDQTVRLAVHAVGSFEGRDALAVYGWIVDRATGAVVWQMLPENAQSERGTLATVDDTLAFEPGLYDAWFTSYGDPHAPVEGNDKGLFERLGSLISPDGRLWHGDAERWRFQLRYAEEIAADVVHGVEGADGRPDKNLPASDGLVWTSGPARNRADLSYLFEVSDAVELRLQGAGEVVRGEMLDGAVITRVFDGEVVWDMANAPLTWAGGSRKNQQVDATITLPRGFYKASYSTDQSHAYDSWTGNPPLNPVRWGLTITVADQAMRARISPFDPWNGRLPRIASFSCVGEDELLENTFTLSDTTAVMISAVGEVIGSSAYDYAVLLRQRPNTIGTEEVWSMENAATGPAGGADKNRLAEAVLSLVPGTYVLSYRTDGSHDCSEFNGDPPDNPDRWGATLFAIDPDFDPNSVTRPDPDSPEISPLGTDSLGAPMGEVLVRFDRVRNDEHRRASFMLDESTTVRIYALGEILPSGAYDYGWIEDANGESIWSMNRENTSTAGGSAKNRVFDGSLTLPAGRFTVHYTTDDSHAYGDFNQPPNDPSSWGIVIYRQ